MVDRTGREMESRSVQVTCKDFQVAEVGSKLWYISRMVFFPLLHSLLSPSIRWGLAELIREGNGTYSSILVWKIPWTEEPGRLQSMGSLRVGHDWATSLSHFTFMHWRRTWQPTPVFLPRELQGLRGLVGCRPWGHTDSDTTETT